MVWVEGQCTPHNGPLRDILECWLLSRGLPGSADLSPDRSGGCLADEWAPPPSCLRWQNRPCNWRLHAAPPDWAPTASNGHDKGPATPRVATLVSRSKRLNVEMP